MVSGKYSALAGAISREQAIANISSNLANISTSGYKRTQMSFESLLRGASQIDQEQAKGINYSRVAKNSSDFSPGAIKPTDAPLDLALGGDGFFKVQGPNGISYTRRGDFVVNSDGVLTTSNGLPVLSEGNGQITIPDVEISKISFGEDGTVYTQGPQGARAAVDRLGIVDFNDRTALRRETDTLFVADNAGAEVAATNPQVIQGSLELSNVNMSAELTRLIDSYRTFETYHKVLASYKTISEQQEELGTLA